MLTLLEMPKTVDVPELKNSFLNYRFYIVNTDQKEKLQFGGSKIKLQLFNNNENDGGFGNRLSWNRIFDENNKFIDNGTLTLVAFVSF
jgi:hypothetical protein